MRKISCYTSFLFQKYLIFGFLLTSCALVRAQDAQSYLEKTIDAHQAFFEYVQAYPNPNFISKGVIDNAKGRFDAAIQYVDLTIKSGNADQIKAARYFRTTSTMRWAQFLAFAKDKKAALDVLKPAMPDIESWKPQDFPLTYKKGEKVFVQKHDPFFEAQSLAFIHYGEWIFGLENQPETAKIYVERALQSRWLTNWARFAAHYFHAQVAKNSTELPAHLANLLTQFKTLNNEEKNVAQKTQEGSPQYVARQFRLILEQQKDKKTQIAYPNFAENCARAAKELVKYPEVGDDLTAQLFDIAVRGNFANDEALSFAKSKLFAQNAKKDPLFPFDSVQFVQKTIVPLGQLVLEKKYPAVEQSLDCSTKNTLGALYTTFKDAEKAKKLFDAAKICEQKVAEDKRRADTKFNFMIGFYPVTAGWTKFTNLGGHVDFRGRHNAHSFGYNIVKDRRDYAIFASNIKEPITWSGFKARYAYKHFLSQFGKLYWGGMFSYAEKQSFRAENQTLDYMTATVVEDAQRLTAEFRPTEKQYEVMALFGFQALKKLVATDLHIGLGGSFNKFDGGNPRYWEKTGVTLEDNEFMSKKRTTVFYPQFRLSWSIGLNFGKPR